MAGGWQAFWGGSHRIYVNDRHLAAHYARIADDLIALLAPRPRARLLDWGCGDALASPRLADVIPPDVGMLPDIVALLRAGARHGFLAAALAGMVATFFSDYRRLRRELGLTTFSEGEIRAMVERHGFTATRLRNIGFSPHRKLLRAVPAQ
jgi:hypothetical protein